jgi:hypothetical protein
MRTGSKLGWMTPLLGDAFFTSAINPGLPVGQQQTGRRREGGVDERREVQDCGALRATAGA